MNYEQERERYRQDERYKAYLKTEKWKQIAKRRMEIDNYICQGCGCRGTVKNPLETHHLTYRHIYNEENWIFEDLVTVCRACHGNLHKIMERVTNKDGRKGWKANPRIPRIHVFTLSGETLEIKEENRQ